MNISFCPCIAFQYSIKRLILLSLILIGIGIKVEGLTLNKLQVATDSILMTPKSIPADAGKQIEEFANEELENSISHYNENHLVLMQTKSFIAINNEINKANSFIKQGYNYRLTLDNTSNLLRIKDIAIDGVIKNADVFHSNRNLTTTSIILDELQRRNNIWLEETLKFHQSLGNIQNRLDSLAKDSLLYQVPSDSAYRSNYYIKLTSMRSRITPVNKSLSDALDSIQQVELQVNQIQSVLEADIAETAFLRKQLHENRKIRELDSFNKKISDKPLSEVITFSIRKMIILVGFYLANHFYSFVMMGLLIVIISFYFILLIRKTKKAQLFEQLREKTYLLSHPVSASILIAISLFQIILTEPPIFISGALWLITLISLSFILWKVISQNWISVWLAYLLLFIVTLADNLLLSHTKIESWIILIISLSGTSISILLIHKQKKRVQQNYTAFIPIIALVALELLAVFYILTGRYNLAKTIMSNGYFLLIVTYTLYWTLKLLKDSMTISRFFHIRADDERYKFPYDEFNRHVSPLMKMMIGAVSIYLVSRTSYSLQAMTAPFIDAFNAPHSIGKFSFTFESIFIFILIITLSWFISWVVSFLTIDSEHYKESQKESGPGSWLLLVRIAIFTIGILLACMAAGIPLDRISVIIGALSVGIGFGLQTLINNLVSGLIIAFEKPINVGDIVEISGQVGKMKSIGIRSSVVTTWDGADVIIPNGDLMSQHLINWTLGNTKRRFELSVGVAYGTDLEQTQQLLTKLLDSDKRILKHPEPLIQINQFNKSSIDFVLKFWVTHFSIGLDVKSDLIISIDKLFKENNIIIPFPQLDIRNVSIESTHEQ